MLLLNIIHKKPSNPKHPTLPPNRFRGPPKTPKTLTRPKTSRFERCRLYTSDYLHYTNNHGADSHPLLEALCAGPRKL